MAISLTRYVDVTSGLGAGAVVPTRDLVARLFTSNNLLPPQSFISFTTAAEVGSYFGLYSEEYLRALFYFGWTSKNLTQAQSIQYARWVNAAVPPMIFPDQNGGTLATNWVGITNGSFVLTMGGFTYTLSGLDFSGIGSSLAAVATIIEDAIQAESGGGSVWTGATVTYSSTYGGFLLVGGADDVVTNPVIVAVGGGGTDITPAGLLGWLPQYNGANNGAIWASGSAVETITQTLTTSSAASNNFGSFAFLTNLGITQQNVVDAANWNNGENVLYMYSQGVTPANASAWAAAVASIGGVGLTLSPTFTFQMSGTLSSSSNVVSGLTSNVGMYPGMVVTDADSYLPAGTVITSLVGSTGLTLSNPASAGATELLTFNPLQFPEQMPMMIEAATNYLGFNTVQNYEFQQFPGITPSVSSDSAANTYDGISINYYGQTQTAGTNISFYQRGVLMGLADDITDMNAYVNEIWLKDAASAAIMGLLLTSSQVPANNQGRNMILGILQGVVNQALNNGSISVGKTLTTAQQTYITAATGDPLAWYQVQNTGYWVDVVITSSGSPLQYTATYTLIYSKDDVIRKVVGTHTLI